MILVKLQLIFSPTSTEVERSFSKMKLIKTRLCNTMGDERMFNLMLCSAHLEILDNIDTIALLNKFYKKTFSRRSDKDFLVNSLLKI